MSINKSYKFTNIEYNGTKCVWHFVKNSPAFFSQIYMQYGLNSRASLTKISLFACRTTFFPCAIQTCYNNLTVTWFIVVLLHTQNLMCFQGRMFYWFITEDYLIKYFENCTKYNGCLLDRTILSHLWFWLKIKNLHIMDQS